MLLAAILAFGVTSTAYAWSQDQTAIARDRQHHPRLPERRRHRSAPRRADPCRSALPRRNRPRRAARRLFRQAAGGPVLVYYKCPLLCTTVLNELCGCLTRCRPASASNFDVLTVSFDPRENDRAAWRPRRSSSTSASTPARTAPRAGTFSPATKRTSSAHIDGRLPLRLGPQVPAVRPRQRHHGADAGGQSLTLLLRHRLRPEDLRIALVEASDNKTGSLANVDPAVLLPLRSEHRAIHAGGAEPAEGRRGCSRLLGVGLAVSSAVFASRPQNRERQATAIQARSPRRELRS